MDPTSQGRRHYQEKNYEKALQAFDRAVIVTTDSLRLTALDHRAATNEKLGKLQAALKDAKQMVELKPDCAKGYLRCGKVLLLKEQDVLAQKIYERGLQKVKVGIDPDRPLLQSMLNRLLKKKKPAPCFDPFEKLPPELAAMVCKYLDTRDLVICLAISKPWNKFFESLYDRWTTIDLRMTRRIVSKTSLKAYLRRSSFGIVEAYLPVKPSDPASLERVSYIMKHCTKLAYLELSRGHVARTLSQALSHANQLKVLVLNSCYITIDEICMLLRLSPQLKSMSADKVDNQTHITPQWPQMNELEELKLIYAHEADESSVFLFADQDNLAQLFPTIRSVTFRGWSIYGPNLFSQCDLENLDLQGCSFERRITLQYLQNSLKHLNFAFTTLSGNRSASNLLVVSNIEHLESIDCRYSRALTFESTIDLMTPSIKSGTLRQLKLGPHYITSDAGHLVKQIPLAPSIRNLSLDGFQCKEDILITIVEKFTNLVWLDISNTQATGVLIRILEDREHGPLRWLRMDNCIKVSSDAVDYARAKGTVVEISHNSEGPRWRDRFSWA